MALTKLLTDNLPLIRMAVDSWLDNVDNFNNASEEDYQAMETFLYELEKQATTGDSP